MNHEHASVSAVPAVSPTDGAITPVSAGQSAAAAPGPITGAFDSFGTDAPPPKRIDSGLLTLATVVAVAGVSLVGMRALGLRPGSALGKTSFDTTLLDSTGKVSIDHAAVLADLNASRVSLQVASDNVKRNPFEIDQVVPTQTLSESPDDPNARAALAEAERIRQTAADRKRTLIETLKSLAVNSIVDGSTPVARISGRAYRPGERIANMFVVRAIRGRVVELEHEGVVYTLELNRGGYGVQDTPPPEAAPQLPPPSKSAPTYEQYARGG